MNYWEACEAQVTAAEAIEECRRHEVAAQVREGDGALIEIATGELIAEADDEGDYSGEAIIGFLGY
ncbi:hypothetical protein B5E41_30170 [Rhizobium esperanzae]|uniref:Uncharacterized protein n=1 Tax=Rhizobium esperanzae TaxID=1967781 RepID=A0A246DN76_9HYPH|nr:hypothetical protein [Rhizobium esperanzae]OWO89708.1 hypothetical protein B5E41_30170 [Rhizobium esperanzae]